MKNLVSITLFLITCWLLSIGCHKTKDCYGPLAGNLIRFDAPAVGQISRYIGLEGERYYGGNGTEFNYVNDTLVLEIIAQDSVGFEVAETLHYTDSISGWYDYLPDSTFHYYLRISNDTLHLAPIGSAYVLSRLFNVDALPLTDIPSSNVALKGWKTEFGYCECYREGYTKDYTLFGRTYSRLNVVMDNRDMQLDGPGQTYVYSAQYGIVKFARYSWWTSTGYGWDLLPE